MLKHSWLYFFLIILVVSQINYYFCMRYNSKIANKGDND